MHRYSAIGHQHLLIIYTKLCPLFWGELQEHALKGGGNQHCDVSWLMIVRLAWKLHVIGNVCKSKAGFKVDLEVATLDEYSMYVEKETSGWLK